MIYKPYYSPENKSEFIDKSDAIDTAKCCIWLDCLFLQAETSRVILQTLVKQMLLQSSDSEFNILLFTLFRTLLFGLQHNAKNCNKSQNILFFFVLYIQKVISTVTSSIKYKLCVSSSIQHPSF